jgi:hypothetical protein
MFFVDAFVALLVAVILSAIFIRGFRRQGPWASYLIFFIVVFLAAWAGGVWVSPGGLEPWGPYWLPFLLVGLIFGLLLAASAPPRPPRSRAEVDKNTQESSSPEPAYGVCFWFLLMVLGVVILAHYL